MQHVQAAPMLAQAAALLPAYRARRVDGIIDYLLDETERVLADSPAAEQRANIGMRRATRQWLASTWRASSRSDAPMWVGHPPSDDEQLDLAALGPLWAARVPADFNPSAPLLSAPHWRWGLYTLEFVADLTVELLRRTQRLHALVKRWKEGRGHVVPGPVLPQPEASDSPPDWLACDMAPSPVGDAQRTGRPRVGDVLLQPIWQQAYTLSGNVRLRRRKADATAGEIGSAGFLALIEAWRMAGGERPSRPHALKLLRQLLCSDQATEAATQTSNDVDAVGLFTQLAALQPPMAQILAAHTQASGRADVEEAVDELRAIHTYLFGPATAGEADGEVDRLAWRVLALEVLEVSAGSRRGGPDARAEVMQISARLKCALGGSSDPNQKLNGMQLAHFGAFYKRSWRANDWTFGCLDGIDRAVRIALNADALQRRYGQREVDGGNGKPEKAAAYVKAYLHGLAVEGAEPEIVPYLRRQWQAEEAAITRELQWLDEASTVPPPVLEHCATALSRRLQLEALRRELPEIATSLIAERESGAPPSYRAGVRLLALVAPTGKAETPTPEDAQVLVENGLLGAENLGLQIGTDLFTRTSSQGLATAHAALSSRHGGLNALNVLFKLTEWPLRILYWLANRLSQGGSTAAALEGAALGVGGALVAAGLLDVKLPGAALALGWALLAGVLGATLLRSARLGALVLLLLLGGLWWIDKLAFAQLVAACVAVLLLTQPWGGTLAMVGIVLAAVWWSAGGSVGALELLWHQLNPWPAAPTSGTVAPSVEAVSAAAKLKLALWPALLVLALVLLNLASRWAAGVLRRSSWPPLRRAERLLLGSYAAWRRRREARARKAPPSR